MCGARVLRSVKTTLKKPCLSITIEWGRTAYTRKGPRLWRINLFYDLNVTRVASVSDLAARGGLSINTHSLG